MPIFKMPNCLPQSIAGSIEYHFGHKCEIRQDGVYINLTDPATIANFKAAGRIVGVIEDDPKPAPVVVETPKQPEPIPVAIPVLQEPVEEKTQTIADVVENGSGKRVGRPPKAAE